VASSPQLESGAEIPEVIRALGQVLDRAGRFFNLT
jgi:hypothetical protein